MSDSPRPIRERPIDAVLAVVCAVFVFTTFFPDITAVLRVDLVNFEATRADPPVWPPMWILEPLVDYARACDHLFLHNPPFYRAAMWGDIFYTGPYYVAACYAFWRGCNWIRIPTIIYAAHVLTIAPIMIVEQLEGAWASPNPAMLFGFYTPYWVFAIVVMIRVRHHRPFDGHAQGDSATSRAR